MQYLPGAVLISTGFAIYLVVSPPVTTAPLGAVVVVVAVQAAAAIGYNCQTIAAAGAAQISTVAATAAVGAARVSAASSPAAA